MAITTLDGVVAGAQPPINFSKGVSGTLVAGRTHSYFYTAGYPGAAATPSPGISGAALTSYSGQLPYTNPGSGNRYLSRFSGIAQQSGVLMLCDRLWHNSGYTMTITSEQVHTGAQQIPARDINGQNNGVGVFAAVEVSGQTGAGTPTLTLKYTNSAGTTGKTATGLFAGTATSIVGTFYQIGLAAGDVGIQKAESLTLSGTWTSGTISTVLYRIIAQVELVANTPYAIDAVTGGMPRMYNDSVPFLVFMPNTTTTTTMVGQVVYTDG